MSRKNQNAGSNANLMKKSKKEMNICVHTDNHHVKADNEAVVSVENMKIDQEEKDVTEVVVKLQICHQ
jgi:hypothetical protein